ncbi:endonuclease III [Patescibacteria group bacterium]|nr:endonuclease III [Patescibacteria group bacterium]
MIKLSKKPAKKERALKVAKLLPKIYKRKKTMLTYKNPWECLVAVQLSAQCTDKRVNMVTPALFKKYKKVEDYANAKREEFEKDIKSTGFYRNKAKNIIGAAKMVMKDFHGNVPRKIEDLLRLPGVARKSANVILFNAYDIIEGVAVDTHVMRITNLLGLISKKAVKNPVKIEKEIMELLPKKYYGLFSLLITEHGREVCVARKPKCEMCKFNKICPSSRV